MLGSEVFTSYAILDHTMTVRYKSGSLSYYYLNSIVDELLEECGELCAPCSGNIDSDGDGIDDECDDCPNMPGDINDDFIVDVLDLVSVVNIILNGGINSSDYTDCELSDANFNGDSLINILDVISIINVIMSNNYLNNYQCIINN